MRIGVISGKGGVGKSLIAASLAYGLHLPGADADVEATNLHIYLKGRVKEVRDVGSFTLAERTGPRKGKCMFGALDEKGEVNPWLCEGCGLCAITGDYVLKERAAGKYLVFETKLCPGLRAIQLYPGAKGAGKLVDILLSDFDNGVVDISPGLACPTISALKYCDLCLVVAEPTQISLNYAERLADIAAKMGKKVLRVLNKADLAEISWGDAHIPFFSDLTTLLVQNKQEVLLSRTFNALRGAIDLELFSPLRD